MSKLDRKQLEEKEKQLRSELNQASDEFENQLMKVAGYAIVSGLVSYGLYKLVSPKKKSKAKKSLKKEDQVNLAIEKTKTQPDSPSTLARVAGAIVPIIVSKIGSEIFKKTDED